MRLTKIICTIGPSCDTFERIRELHESGMDVARLNFSHGSYPYFDGIIESIRKVSDKIPIVLDTKGPEVRTGKVEEPIPLHRGQIIEVTHRKAEPGSMNIFVNHDLTPYAKKKDILLIDDGKVELRVIERTSKGLVCKVRNDCSLGSNKSVVIPGRDIKIENLTKKDVEDIRYGIRKDLDVIALSLVKVPETIHKVRELVKGTHIKVFSKIEHQLAVENLDAIIKESDGIMVARGDLGLSMPPEDVPILQKLIVRKCNAAGKPVIVATQMLESMISNPRPTRAEANDVANAIYDGTDCVMLSGETAAGKFPIQSVRMMARICVKVDKVCCPNQVKLDIGKVIPETIGKNVIDMVNDIGAKAIISHTASGFTPTLISRYKPMVPIITVTPNQKTYRQVSMVRGIFQIDVKDVHKEHYFRKAVLVAMKKRLLGPNDMLILTYNNSEQVKTTNCLEIREAKEFL